MNELIPFDFETQAVRVIMNDDAEPWFVASDICSVLGISKHRDAVARLDDDETRPVVVDTSSGNREMSSVNESGLYSLIFKSRKPEAKKFRKWVTSEVLPTLRKTGRYIFDDNLAENEPETPDEMASLGRGMRIREHRRVFSEISQLVHLANKLHRPQLDLVNKISQGLTGIDTVAMLSEAGWSAPCLPEPAQTEMDFWRSQIEEWLNEPEQRETQHISNKEILAGAIGLSEKNMTVAATVQVGLIMKRLGWGKKRIRQQGSKLGYVYVRPITTTH